MKIHIQRPIQTLPVRRRYRFLPQLHKRPQRGITYQALTLSVASFRTEGRNQIIFSLPHMTFRRPIIQLRPKTCFIAVKHFYGIAPMDQILTFQSIKTPRELQIRKSFRIEYRRICIILLLTGSAKIKGSLIIISLTENGYSITYPFQRIKASINFSCFFTLSYFHNTAFCTVDKFSSLPPEK
mgnify:CR=1 FL=1